MYILYPFSPVSSFVPFVGIIFISRSTHTNATINVSLSHVEAELGKEKMSSFYVKFVLMNLKIVLT